MEGIFNLANYSFNLLAIPYFICGILLLFFGIFVFLANRRSLINIGYFLICINIFIWMVPAGIAQMSVQQNIRVFWFVFLCTFFGANFIPCSSYCLSVGLLGNNRQKKFILPIYFLMALFSVLFWVPGLILKEVRLIGNYFGYPYYFGYGGQYFLVFIICWTIIALWALFNIYKATKVKNLSLSEIKRRKFLLYIYYFGYIGAIEWLPWFGFRIYSIGYLITFIMVVGIAFYGILRYQLFNIKLIIKKAFFYSSGIGLVSGFIIGISFLSQWLTERIPGFRFWFIPLFVGIAAFIIGNLFWQKSKQVEKALIVEKQARQELQRLSEVKDQFLLATQHHLRTPLSIMKGYLSRILSREKDKIDPFVLKEVETVSDSTDRLIKLVNELLDVSQLEVGKKSLDIQPVDLKNTIAGIIDDLRSEIKKKNLNVVIAPDERLIVPADPEKIKIVFSNLIDNAVKYTPKQGKIVIKGEKTDSFYRISVRDSGIGIAPEELPTLFTRYFERGEQAQKLYTTGRGIGLFICAGIVKAHNGRIWAESEGINKGSVFYVELPLVFQSKEVRLP